MKAICRNFFAAVLAALLVSPAQAAALWSIYFMSAPAPCGGWSAPIVSAYNRPVCPIGPYTICPTASVGRNPYDQGQPITIVGYQLTQILSDPHACGYAIVGSAHGSPQQDGADTFASGGGCGGTWSKSKNFSPNGIPQGGGNDAHIDAYAACTTGNYQLLLVVEYTSP